MKSLKELYRIGHGPSSSHTMGPGRAAELYLAAHPEAERFKVTLYGALAASGKGHFTDKILLDTLGEKRTTIHWSPETVLPRHPNAMKFDSTDASGQTSTSWTVYSIGGGALLTDDAPMESAECYPFDSMQQLLEFCAADSLPLWALAEKFDATDIRAFLSEILDAMFASCSNGLQQEKPLPGGLHLPRKARSLLLKTNQQKRELQRTGKLAAYAYAVAEENAALGKIVTAPTCGSCGVIPAVLRYFMEEYNSGRDELINALAIAGLIGLMVKQNGSISGAEVGCQGEIGTACAMASGAAAYLLGGTSRQIEYAAEIGLEHFLGLTCDPVMGLVQVPCIERNAIAANRAFIAAELALLSDGIHMVSFDAVVKAMLQTGHDLPMLYRETATGGLAAIIGK